MGGQSRISTLQVLLPCLPTTLGTFVQGITEATAAILFAACQCFPYLLLLLVILLVEAKCQATSVHQASSKKSFGRPLPKRKRAYNIRKARVCLALSVFKVGMQ